MEARCSDTLEQEPFSVRDTVIVVTGSTRGIGRALAQALHALGARVWVHGRAPRACAEVASQLCGLWVAADLSDPDGVAHLCRTVQTETDVVHCLINNAAMEIPRPIAELEQEFVAQTMQVNVTAPVMTTRMLLPALQSASGASVINMTSMHQSVPYPHNSVYSMSKAALAMFTETAAIELARYGIRVNNLAPGAIATDINRGVIEAIGRDQFAEWIPLGHVGTTAELIGAVRYLASSASRYVTGTTLYVDGGYSRNLVRYWPTAEDP